GTKDALLELSLDGAVDYSATLFHRGDDYAYVYAIATDVGNNSELNRPTFKITKPGATDSPLRRWAAFRVVCLNMR
ncbi:MAG: hypothetical protein AAF492_03420, partial [Verrucomicrobiota bacterium]